MKIEVEIKITLSKIMAYLIFGWMCVMTVILTLKDKYDIIIAISGIGVGAITSILTVKNLTQNRQSNYLPREFNNENGH